MGNTVKLGIAALVLGAIVLVAVKVVVPKISKA